MGVNKGSRKLSSSSPKGAVHFRHQSTGADAVASLSLLSPSMILGEKKRIKSNDKKYNIKKATTYGWISYSTLVFTLVCGGFFSLFHIFIGQRQRDVNQHRPRYTNMITKPEATTTAYKPRVIGITPLQYAPSNTVSARPVLLSHSKLLTVDTTTLATNVKTFFNLKESSIPTDGHFIDPRSWYTPNAQDLVWHNDRCEVQYPWQLESFPTCNNLHELDLSTMKFINNGYFRSAFEMGEVSNGNLMKFVYKTLSFKWDITEEKIGTKRMDSVMNGQRLDALVMERGSSSEFIPNLHGYCSSGLIMDFMSEGTMWDYVKAARIAKKRGDSSVILSTLDKLRVAIHIATGVQDVHETGDVKQIPAFFHNDLKWHQFLFQDGIFKLNDFNTAQPITFAKKKNATEENKLCLDDELFGKRLQKMRSFEEHLRSVGDPRFEPFSGDKIDVYMMGNVLYTILTELFLFEEPMVLNIEKTSKEIVAGRRSPYPDEIENSTDPAQLAVKKAIEMCWIEEWRKRPSARSITEYLTGELRNITGEATPDLRIILPQRDPGQTPSDSEYRMKGKGLGLE